MGDSLSHLDNLLVIIVIYQWKFSSAKLNHANLLMNEKRSLIESEGIYLSNSCKVVCSHCDELKNAIYGYYGYSYWGNPFALISRKRVVLLATIFSFICFFGLFGRKQQRKGTFSVKCFSVENGDARAVFTWMSRLTRIRFGFALLSFLFCTEALAPLAIARPVRGNANQSWLAHAHFPVLHADHVVTLRFDWFIRLPVTFVTDDFVLYFDIKLKI